MYSAAGSNWAIRANQSDITRCELIHNDRETAAEICQTIVDDLMVIGSASWEIV